MGSKVWTETDGAERCLAARAAEELKYRELVRGLKRCSVCGGTAEAKVFGMRGEGVWVGCNRSSRCARYIELHTEGWSLEEAAAEWNRWNGGVVRWVRVAKRWISERIGRAAREERRRQAVREIEERERLRRRAEVLGAVVDFGDEGGKGILARVSSSLWAKIGRVFGRSR